MKRCKNTVLQEITPSLSPGVSVFWCNFANGQPTFYLKALAKSKILHFLGCSNQYLLLTGTLNFVDSFWSLFMRILSSGDNRAVFIQNGSVVVYIAGACQVKADTDPNLYACRAASHHYNNRYVSVRNAMYTPDGREE